VAALADHYRAVRVLSAEVYPAIEQHQSVDKAVSACDRLVPLT